MNYRTLLFFVLLCIGKLYSQNVYYAKDTVACCKFESKIFQETFFPELLKSVEISETSINDVENRLGKPSAKLYAKNDLFIYHPYGAKYYEYKELGIKITFQITKNDKIFRVVDVQLKNNSKLHFGKNIQTSITNYKDVLSEIGGTPKIKYDINNSIYALIYCLSDHNTMIYIVINKDGLVTEIFIGEQNFECKNF